MSRHRLHDVAWLPFCLLRVLADFGLNLALPFPFRSRYVLTAFSSGL